MTWCRVTAAGETGRKVGIWFCDAVWKSIQSKDKWIRQSVLDRSRGASLSTMKGGLAQQFPCLLQLVPVPERPLWSPFVFSPRFTLDRPVPLLGHRLYKRRKANDFCFL